MPTMDKDFQAENWWATVSGAGTAASGIEPSWADDYTRHRSGVSTTYTGVESLIGRADGHTGRELDSPKL